jgi:N-acyl homoserine lactone hydrolase
VTAIEVLRLYHGDIQTLFFDEPTPIHGYAIKHPQGVVLVDTGLGSLDRWPWAQDYKVQTRAMDAVLAEHDLSLADVTHVLVTHLASDHAGQNFMFKYATFVVQTTELEYARAATTPGMGDPRTWWDFPNARFEPLIGDAEVLPGIACLYTPGHTPGHQSVLVHDADARQMIVGDASYTIDFYEEPSSMSEDHPGFQMQVRNPGGIEVWRQSIEKLKSANPTEVHFCHDPRILVPGRT